jgi:hypothetical protein
VGIVGILFGLGPLKFNSNLWYKMFGKNKIPDGNSKSFL